MPRLCASLSLWAIALAVSACASGGGRARSDADASRAAACAMSVEDSSWLVSSVAAWRLTRERHLRLARDTIPQLILFDRRCVYHVDVARGTGFSGTPHLGLIPLPNDRAIPVRPVGITSPSRDDSSLFLALALLDVWRSDPMYRYVGGSWRQYLTGAFIHELTHAQILRGYLPLLREMSPALYPDSIRDDVIQDRFGGDESFAASVARETTLLYRSALNPILATRLDYARGALELIRHRRARVYVGELESLSDIEQMFLDLEGVAQWAAFTHARNAFHRRLSYTEALERFRQGEQYWSQDQGLALFVALESFDPDWQSRFFVSPPVPGGALTLLERALERYR